ncbi:MAG: TIGR04282 family arsenosugar biosynthesis glycosyltransferase [Acidiferrobacterales bacterium]
MKSPDLILFAKQPNLGQVKTRLQPDYDPDQIVEIAKFLIRATVELAVSGWPSSVYLYGVPDADHAFFHELAEEFRVHLASQTSGDLGKRMLQALREGISRGSAAAVMGCDVPQCRWEVVERAHEHLASGKNVIGPTEDGGYYLIGLQKAPSRLFDNIEWGSASVLQTTLVQARKFGMEFEQLPKLRDVDTGDALWLVAQEYEPLRKHLYHVLRGSA